MVSFLTVTFSKFLSTPSARRATKICLYGEWRIPISIHALREEGDRRCDALPDPGQISIHALREEGDLRAPARFTEISISIHALREEGDVCHQVYFLTFANFYPRPPRGGRRFRNAERWAARGFLSTPSARRATVV